VLHKAFADESFREDAVHGFYVLAAAVIEPGARGRAREAMLGLRGARKSTKLHWNEMDRHQQAMAAKTVASLEGFHVVTVGTPVPRRRQERARAMCLMSLVRELHDFGVGELVMEGRTPELDQRDISTVVGARYTLPRGAVFRVEHLPGAGEPILWAADIVAGAVRAAKQDRGDLLEILAECVHEIDVVTDC
jgi:hypothetical protein